MHKICRPFYRLLQRAIVLEGVAVMTARSCDVARAQSNDQNVESLTKERLQEFMGRGEAPHCESLLERLSDERVACFGAISGECLFSFAWFHQGSAEAEMNYGRTPATATSILLQHDAAFIFHAYTDPRAQGRGFLSAVLAHAAASLRQSHQVEALVTTTEIVNDAARAAFRRAGFSDAGTYWRFGLRSHVAGRYPLPRPPIIAYGRSS